MVILTILVLMTTHCSKYEMDPTLTVGNQVLKGVIKNGDK